MECAEILSGDWIMPTIEALSPETRDLVATLGGNFDEWEPDIFHDAELALQGSEAALKNVAVGAKQIDELLQKVAASVTILSPADIRLQLNFACLAACLRLIAAGHDPLMGDRSSFE